MGDRFAYIISIILHPLLMSSYLFLIIMMLAPALMQPLPLESFWQVLVIIFLVTTVIPAISIGTLRLSNFITDINLVEKKQRVAPFLFVTCFYGITAYMFYTKLNINNLIFIVFTTTTSLLFILTLITNYWKISVHGAGIGGMIGFLIAISSFYPFAHFKLLLAFVVFLSGLVVFSRLHLNAHTPKQVYAGMIFGLIFCFLSIYIFM